MGRVIGMYGDENSLDPVERAHLDKIRAIEEFGSARRVFISHGGDEDWFVVEPQVGTLPASNGRPIHLSDAVSRLLKEGRTVYAIEPKLWRNRRHRRRAERLELAWRPMTYLVAGVVIGVAIRALAG